MANISTAQKIQRAEFFRKNGISVIGAGFEKKISATKEYTDVMKAALSHNHSATDGGLAAIAKVTKIPAFSLEKRITNLFSNTFPKLNVPLYRLTP